MLARDSGPTRHYAVLISMELEDGVCTPEQAAMQLGDALSYTEGVGVVDIDVLGEMEVAEAQDE